MELRSEQLIMSVRNKEVLKRETAELGGGARPLGGLFNCSADAEEAKGRRPAAGLRKTYQQL